MDLLPVAKLIFYFRNVYFLPSASVLKFRPHLSFLEKDMKTKCVLEMEENQTILHPTTAGMNKGDPR